MQLALHSERWKRLVLSNKAEPLWEDAPGPRRMHVHTQLLAVRHG